eukprot:TRINITY_DN2266_c0_g1_i1.p1 TRINITY_DN2266_c0_g1~~TRINITY_DN2266_c0_g1_i1.p1  ORF type:complete len:183 (+),score=74.36 TRINITY_DN2266_c0_g1_i1:35-583(+)
MSNETERLKEEIQNQVNRLLIQLSDLEEFRDELDETEYNDTKSDTMKQIEEFQETLQRVQEGNVSLVDELAAVQIALRAAISKSSKTPEILAMFAAKDSAKIRKKIRHFEKGFAKGKLTESRFIAEKLQLLALLQSTGGDLSDDETAFLAQNSSSVLKNLQSASNLASESLIDAIASQIQND